MANLIPRTKSHKYAHCERLCAQHTQHPIRVCVLCVCGAIFMVGVPRILWPGARTWLSHRLIKIAL